MQRADRRHATREHGKVAESKDGGQVPDQPVDDETADPAVARLGGDEVTEHGVHRRAAGIDDDDVSRLRDVQRLVHHQVVAGEHLHGARRPENAQAGIRHRMDLRPHRVQAIHLIRDRRCLERREPLDDVRARTVNARAHAETRSGMHLGRDRLFHHVCPLRSPMRALGRIVRPLDRTVSGRRRQLVAVSSPQGVKVGTKVAARYASLSRLRAGADVKGVRAAEPNARSRSDPPTSGA